MVPGADTVLQPGARISAVTTVSQEAELHQVFTANGEVP